MCGQYSVFQGERERLNNSERFPKLKTTSLCAEIQYLKEMSICFFFFFF